MRYAKAVNRARMLNKMVPTGRKTSYVAQRRGELDQDSIIVQLYDDKPVGVAGY